MPDPMNLFRVIRIGGVSPDPNGSRDMQRRMCLNVLFSMITAFASIAIRMDDIDARLLSGSS